jgi:trans-aconitate methyltransferase
MDWDEWQKRWDAQQESYLPDREERYAAMLDAVAVAAGDAPRVVDLAGGTGSITRRVLARFPRASSVVVDLDPALLAIAAGTFDGDARVRVCAADLSDPAWTGTLGEPPASFDAVLTATALHWLPSVVPTRRGRAPRGTATGSTDRRR